MRAESKPLLERVVKHLKKNEEWRQELLEAAQKDPRLSSSPYAGTEQPKLENFARQLLRKLPFESMRRREEQVPEAHEKTFGWVFQPPDAQHTEENGTRSWTSFVDWLENGSSLYWITGKAGAGKSTLMKLICTDNRTTTLTRNWAKDHPVVISYCYLWNSGAELQMSQDGLLRTLLYGALYQRNQAATEGYFDLIAKCFSERWEIHEFLEPVDLWPISGAELQLALERLVGFDPTTRYVFFIGGLDEYSGQHSDLVGFIQRMAKNNNIKLCVASRPWPVFGDAFEHGPSLRLEDLTYPDFVEFVESNLANSPGYAQLRAENALKTDELVQDIIEKASGVFLWVSLVVRMVLEGLEDGERLSDLHSFVDTLPADLEKLYQKMLDSIGPKKMEHASQIFQIFLTAQTSPISVNVLGLSFADEDDPKLPFEHPIRPLTKEEEAARTDRMCRRLQSLCKGLLEAKKNSRAKVDYLHRTVKDFLHQEKTWQRLVSVTQTSFKPSVSLCRSFLLQLKCLEQDQDMIHMVEYSQWNLVKSFIRYATMASNDTKELISTLYDELAITTETIISRDGTCSAYYCWCHGPVDHTDGPFLSLAISQGLFTYVHVRLSQTAPTKGKLRQEGTALLQTAVDYESHGLSIEAPDGKGSMVKLLLELGANPNVSSSTWSMTAWESLVKTSRLKSKVWDAEILRLFLEHGADPFIDLTFLNNSTREFADVFRLQRQLKLKTRSQSVFSFWKKLSPWRKGKDRALLLSPDASST